MLSFSPVIVARCLGEERADSGNTGRKEEEPVGLPMKDSHHHPRLSPFVSWLSSLHSGTASELFHRTACEQMDCEPLHGKRPKKRYEAYCVFFAQPLERWEHLLG